MTLIEKLDAFLLNSETEIGMVLDVPVVAAFSNVVKATAELRTAQKAYMSNRGDRAAGEGVGRASAKVDQALIALEGLLV